MFDFRNLTDDQKQKIIDDGGKTGLIFNDETLLNPMKKIPEFLNDAPHLYLTWLLTQPEYLHSFVKYIVNFDLMPFQVAILQNMWTHKFPMFIASRGAGKSSLLALYALLRCMLIKDRKIIVVGAGFRQSKVIFDYIQWYWDRAPLLQDCYPGKENGPKNMIDMMKFNLRDGHIIAIPIGATGDKVRGLRANDTIADEFSSINQEVFETVIAGFSSVKSQPAEAAREETRRQIKKWFNIEIEEETDRDNRNQLIVSGTAYYQFGHFYKYWKQWKETILSRGEGSALEKIFQEKGIPEGFDHTDYTIARIPFEIVPHGFMDSQNLARAQLTVNTGVFKNEYQAVFSADSEGFFPRSLIDSCVVKKDKLINLPSGEVDFTATLSGRLDRKYILGLDPASERANLAIVLLELHKDHRRVVYTWTINRKKHIEKVNAGLVGENDYYAYVARKIRELMDLFPIEYLAIDWQGGGVAIIEALHNKNNLRDGEIMIWPIIDPQKPEPSDAEPGLHIIQKINFADSEWCGEANHGLKKDMEDKVLFFPYFDVDAVALANFDDFYKLRKHDTLEQILTEVEELKTELSTIVMTKTPTGKDKWDTNSIIIDGKKAKLDKDRYSALLMANAVARKISLSENYQNQSMHGTYGSDSKNKDCYHCASWLRDQFNELYR